MLYLIAYDLADDQRRGALSDLLAGYGARVQLSVFECELDRDTLAALRARIVELIDEQDDQVRVYPLPADTARCVEILGRRRLEERADFWIV